MYLYVYMYLYIHIHINRYKEDLYVYIYICICVEMYTYMHACIHTCPHATYMHLYVCLHVHVYVYRATVEYLAVAKTRSPHRRPPAISVRSALEGPCSGPAPSMGSQTYGAFVNGRAVGEPTAKRV